MITSRTSAAADWYWSESTPIASAFAAFAAWKTPVPEPPAAAKITSAPPSYMPLAASAPAAGSLNPVQPCCGVDRYFETTLVPGLAFSAPAL